MALHVYIDGFNLYYRLFKNRRRLPPLPPRLKWLNLLVLAEQLMPREDVAWVGYFTVYLMPNPLDPTQQTRQRVYIEALKSINRIEVVPGSFRPTTREGRPVGATSTRTVAFETFEEKGSDVNLACRLVWDGCRRRMSKALVISNDSDLREAIRIVDREMGIPVVVRSPDTIVGSALRQVATHAAPLDVRRLRECQFADEVRTAAGLVVRRPERWASRG